MTDSTPQPTVWPCLAYADAPAAIRFLVEAFGFVEKLVVPGECDGVIVHAQLAWPEGGSVMLNTARDADDPFHTAPGGYSLYVVTDAVTAVYERAVAAGAEVVQKPEVPDYAGDSLVFTVRDPERNRWSFGDYRGV